MSVTAPLTVASSLRRRRSAADPWPRPCVLILKHLSHFEIKQKKTDGSYSFHHCSVKPEGRPWVIMSDVAKSETPAQPTFAEKTLRNN